ncbi:MAG: sugar phosphate isomerase/epimerase [Phycisphaerae bacterium]|nr:sugar phosphate isomerase/epimerase [Phycisphaerae bacterium]
MKPISIQLYSVREQTQHDLPGVLSRIAEIGYKGVEPAGLQGRSPKGFRALLDDLGLVASSTHGPLPTAENVNEIVETAQALGYDMVISGKSPDDFRTRDAILAAAEQFQTAAELLKPHGVRMGYHNHWWEFDEIDGRLGYEIFLEAAPDVFSEMDTYWACNFGAVDVPAMVAKHAARLPILHIKDGPLVRDEPHTAVGAGKMDVPAVIGAADADVLEWLVVELDECAGDMMDAVAASYAYLTGQGLAAGNK